MITATTYASIIAGLTQAADTVRTIAQRAETDPKGATRALWNLMTALRETAGITVGDCQEMLLLEELRDIVGKAAPPTTAAADGEEVCICGQCTVDERNKLRKEDGLAPVTTLKVVPITARLGLTSTRKGVS